MGAMRARPLCLLCLSGSRRRPALALNACGFASSSTAASVANDHEETPDSFDQFAGELHRRRRKADAKRHQKGRDFVDHLIVTVRGGKGGQGAAAFAPSRSGGLGPPSGGNGGNGGNVYLETSPHITSLARIGKRLIGGQGGSGAGNWKNGARGADVIVQVPVGTVIKEIRREGEEERLAAEEDSLELDKEARKLRRRERWFAAHPSGEVGADEYKDAEALLRRQGFWRRTPTFEESPPLELDISKRLSSPVTLASGGKGGLGNPYFAAPPPHARAARIASKGVLPPTMTFSLTLKLLADVGLVGFPNAGKSTILSALTGRKAEVAGYAFTTLNPQIGVVRVWNDGTWEGMGGVVEESEIERKRNQDKLDQGEYLPTPKELRQGDGIMRTEETRFTISDNPGLLPAASENVGLGHSFLRSIERSLALVYVLDLTRPHPERDWRVLMDELEAYKEGLSDKAAVIVLNKADEVGEELGRTRISAVREAVANTGLEVITVSGKYNLGLERLVRILVDRVSAARASESV